MATIKSGTLSAARYLLCLTVFAGSIGSLSAAPVSGSETFKTKCAACHGPDGSGNTPVGKQMKILDLRSPEVQKQTDAQLAAIITAGKAPMPAYGKTLTPAEISEVIAHLRTVAAK